MTIDIFKYLDGDLNKDKREAIEKRIAVDSEFKKEVELCDDINKFLDKHSDYLEIKDFVKEIHKDFLLKHHKVKSQNNIKWLAAACIIILLGLMGGWFFQNSVNYFYYKNFEIWQAGDNVRGYNENSLYQQWVENFENENYNKVVLDFENLPQEISVNAKVILMHANALMHLKDYNAAIDILNNGNTEGSSMLTMEYNWYKGLCYLKLNKRDDAILQFKKLEGNSKYGEKAQQALKRLK